MPSLIRLDEVWPGQGVEMKILFVSSASGGHLFPAISLARQVRAESRKADIVFLTEKNRISRQILKENEFRVLFLSSKPCFPASLSIVSSIIKLLRGSLKTFNFLRELRPDIVVGFGGYVSILPILLAKLFRIKTLIHEQNVTFGRANRLLAIIAETIAVSFDVSRRAFKNPQILSKIIYTGLPLRKDLHRVDRTEAARFFKLDARALTILVMGGSLGSQSINRGFINCLENFHREGYQIIHICGFKDEAEIRAFYDQHPQIAARVFPFLEKMSLAFSIADLCICRSGASVIYELSLFKIPAILIPYRGACGHQLANARILKTSGAAIILDEKSLPLVLEEKLCYVLSKPAVLAAMKERFPSGLNFNARENLSRILTHSATSPEF